MALRRVLQGLFSKALFGTSLSGGLPKISYISKKGARLSINVDGNVSKKKLSVAKRKEKRNVTLFPMKCITNEIL